MQTFRINNKDDLVTFGDNFKKDFIVKINGQGIIGVDGPTQCGKSSVVTEFLKEMLGAEIIDLDSFYQIENDEIIFKGKPEKLKKNKWYIADGALNRMILEKFGLQSVLNIYVKKMVNFGWADRDWLDKQIVEDYGLDGHLGNNVLKRKIYDYHQKYSPEVSSDIVLEISEDYIIENFVESEKRLHEEEL